MFFANYGKKWIFCIVAFWIFLKLKCEVPETVLLLVVYLLVYILEEIR